MTAGTASSCGEATAPAGARGWSRTSAPGRPWSSPEQLTAVGKILYFTARDGVHGPELWRSNGTARGTRLVRDIVPGQGAYSLGSFTNVAGTLFFVASAAPQSGTQTGLWRSNGTAASTGLVKQLAQINYPTAIGGSLYFAASDGTNAGLWRSDGTPAGTVLVKGFEEATCGVVDPCYLTNVAGTLFFTGTDGIEQRSLAERRHRAPEPPSSSRGCRRTT